MSMTATTLDTEVEHLFDVMLADLHRLKLENKALLASVQEKERQIVILQDDVHRLSKPAIYTDAHADSTSWMQDEEEYVAIIKSLIK